jgi:hypothetical protein
LEEIIGYSITSPFRPHPNPSPKEKGLKSKVLSKGEDLGEV